MISTDKMTVLVVDDEPDLCDVVAEMLRPSYNVLKASSATDGFRVMQDNEVHIIITDQRMPTITGVEFLSKVRVRNPLAVRMLFSGYIDVDTIISAINQGHIFRFLKKPYRGEFLEASVRDAADEYLRLVAQIEENDRMRKRVLELERQIEDLSTKIETNSPRH